MIKELTDFKGYFIGSDGSFYSNRSGKMYKFAVPKGKKYYRSVILTKYENGKKVTKTFYIHRLVGEYFIPNPENKPCINHKDGDKTNDNVSNLEWVTYKENSEHAVNVLDIFNKGNYLIRKQINEEKRKEKEIMKEEKRLGKMICIIDTGEIISRTELSKKLNVSKSAISNALNSTGVIKRYKNKVCCRRKKYKIN